MRHRLFTGYLQQLNSTKHCILLKQLPVQLKTTWTCLLIKEFIYRSLRNRHEAHLLGEALPHHKARETFAFSKKGIATFEASR